MNEKQARALFNAHYLALPVLRFKDRPKETFSLTAYDCDENISGYWFLELRTIDQLTDEECRLLAAIVIEDPFKRYQRIEVTRDYAITGFPYIAIHHKNVKYRFNIDCTHVNFSVLDMGEDITSQIDMKPYSCIDFLRSVGIILPFTYVDESGKPVTLSVEEIIAKGWAKIKDKS